MCDKYSHSNNPSYRNDNWKFTRLPAKWKTMKYLQSLNNQSSCSYAANTIYLNICSCRRHSKPLVELRRLDYWLLSGEIQNVAERKDVIPLIKTGHSALVLQIFCEEQYYRYKYYIEFEGELKFITPFVCKFANKLSSSYP